MPYLRAMMEAFEDRAGEPHIRGFLHEPGEPNGSAIVLTHGAGANCQSKLLMEVSNAFADAGFAVLRFDLPFRIARRFGPPRPGDAARDREGLRRAVSLMKERQRNAAAKRGKDNGAEAKASAAGTKFETETERIFLGGHSYGGRQATILASEMSSDPQAASATDFSVVHGLLLLSYPLHPPQKPEQLRTSHFPKLNTPAFFVHGTRDPFATTHEMNSALKLIPGRHALCEIEGAGHDLLGKKTGGELPSSIVREFQAFVIKSAE